MLKLRPALKASALRAMATAPSIRPIVLTGPSGTGKSTLLNRAMKEYPNAFAFSVSHTTRAPREGEEHGVNYYFVTRDEMKRMISGGEFVENVEFGGNMYGTSKKAIEDVQRSGKICILDVELNGVRSLKEHHLNFKFILIRAPSYEVLEQRLRQRGTETEQSIQDRLKHAREDNEAAEKEPGLFDHVIVNDQLDRAYEAFLDAIKDELAGYKQFHEVGAGDLAASVEQPASGKPSTPIVT